MSGEVPHLPAVEGVQLGGHGVEVEVCEVEPREQALVRPLGPVEQLADVVHPDGREWDVSLLGH